ncbi:SHOCT domain-containing protein [Streptomyces sp. NBC_00335]|uniref:SHOCT domain-containing protein n=1 Tax=unclassified Streptomyces TaxID=2593676 RepID=UPI0022563AC0|nr:MULTISPECIES: SHOCT domain-containing protein [unclassified Streptomyces]MCX5404637.1 SHOCT domain-containing protein [Streptomyces sp. NBC_00086]
MFIRPIGSVVNPSQRPSGHPLLRGILARGAYVWEAAQRGAATPAQPQGGMAAASTPAPGADSVPSPAGSVPSPAPSPPKPPKLPAAPSDRREPAGGRPAPHPGPGAPGPVSPGADLTDRLTQLAALAREGLLTPEEFSAAKARLLAG